MALYVHVKPADEQFLHGRVPSPIHLTFRRWQASHARLAGAVGVAAPVVVEVAGAVFAIFSGRSQACAEYVNPIGPGRVATSICEAGVASEQ
jgi:hypothetical protein